MQAAVGQHVEQDREAARGPGAGDAQVGLVLREVEDLAGVGKHGRAGLTEVEAARVDLGDVGDHLGLEAAMAIEEGGEPPEQLVIREGIETERTRHAQFYHRVFRRSAIARVPANRPSNRFRDRAR